MSFFASSGQNLTFHFDLFENFKWGLLFVQLINFIWRIYVDFSLDTLLIIFLGQSQLFLVHIEERLIIVRRDLYDCVSIIGHTSLETVIIANGMDSSYLILIPEFEQTIASEIHTLKDPARVLDVRLSTHEFDQVLEALQAACCLHFITETYLKICGCLLHFKQFFNWLYLHS